ncbi:hypothetical protein C3747_63g134 [Trypanosoma cruzi]|uniref:Uncharacterized protein n=1 Tax=Trypanosoma cruzi TaxID=5693 RepID=A0A2V2WX63_TRYCR|nr:hypothetical protein C3747_63g134 [Trypanosoma cruzi]
MAQLSLLLFLLSFFLFPGCCRGMQVTFASDIHYDPFYGGPDAFGTACRSAGLPLVRRGCESSADFVKYWASDMATRKSACTFVTGDLQRHDFPSLKTTVTATFGFVIERLAAVSPNKTPSGRPSVLVALGNNDVVPDYYFDVTRIPSRVILEEASVMQKNGVLMADEAQQFQQCGYYLRVVSPKLRVIVLHTLLWCNRIVPAIPDGEEDPCSQFKFLTTELENARKANSKVIIMSHIPPMSNIWKVLEGGNFTSVAEDMYWKPLYQKRFNQLMREYSDTVTVQLYGHTHLFYYQALSGGVPFFIVPAISPLYGNAPSYFIAQLDNKSLSLKSLTQRYFDYDWTNGVLVEDLFGDLTDTASLRASAMRLVTDDKLWAKYVRLCGGGVGSDKLFPGGKCNSWCRKVIACSMVSDAWGDIKACVEAIEKEPSRKLFITILIVVIVLALLILGIVILVAYRRRQLHYMEDVGRTQFHDALPMSVFATNEVGTTGAQGESNSGEGSYHDQLGYKKWKDKS